jgi:hypothetical protein
VSGFGESIFKQCQSSNFVSTCTLGLESIATFKLLSSVDMGRLLFRRDSLNSISPILMLRVLLYNKLQLKETQNFIFK